MKIIKTCQTCVKEFTVYPYRRYTAKYCSPQCMKLTHKPPSGSSNAIWKGDNVSRGGLHKWAKRWLKRPLTCYHCGEIKPLDLANKSQQYKRELDDLLWLCKKCHMKYDKEIHKEAHKRSWVTRKINLALRKENSRGE